MTHVGGERLALCPDRVMYQSYLRPLSWQRVFRHAYEQPFQNMVINLIHALPERDLQWFRKQGFGQVHPACDMRSFKMPLQRFLACPILME